MSNIRSSIAGNKGFLPIFEKRNSETEIIANTTKVIVDYDTELKQMWLDHIASNVSQVICEDANVNKNKKQPKAKDTAKLCDCPGSEPGKVKVDADKHLIGCHFRKKSGSGRYTASMSVIPDKITAGFGLGFIIGGEQL
jgi:hypothetical protein